VRRPLHLDRPQLTSLAAEDALKIAVDVATGAKKPSDYPKESFTKAVGIGCDNIDEYYDPNSIF
jgi:ribose transport system substrate-binding protein